MKGFVIAGTMSGSGKTTLTLGLMASFVRKGLRVVPFKVGPDFIDPGHHAQITGIESRNLDGWMLSKTYNQQCVIKELQKGVDGIALIEGVMGLFDGYDGKSDAGSTAQMAKWLNLPIILVVNARSMARSAAALVKGFETFDPDLSFLGVIFNQVGSERHLTYLKEALQNHVRMPFLGGLPRDRQFDIPERHLGLVTADEFTLTQERIDRLANLVDTHVDMDRIHGAIAIGQNPQVTVASPLPFHRSKDKKVRIAIARDKAFCFYYADNLDLLADNGAELIFFSPLNDEHLPNDIDGLYFGGGYPEVFAPRLAANDTLKLEIMERSQGSMPVYGECGGFMYLCREILDQQGQAQQMVGCFPFSIKMSKGLRFLGYREVKMLRDTVIGPKGEKVRGHEFHYSEIIGKDSIQEPFVYEVTPRAGDPLLSTGYQVRNTLGSYHHLHFGSNPAMIRYFIGSCETYGNKMRDR